MPAEETADLPVADIGTVERTVHAVAASVVMGKGCS